MNQKIVFHQVPYAGNAHVLQSLAAPGNGMIRVHRLGEAPHLSGLHYAQADVNAAPLMFADLRGLEAECFYLTWLRDPVDLAVEAFVRIRNEADHFDALIKQGLVGDWTLSGQIRRILEADTLESYSIKAWEDAFPVYPAGRFSLDFDRFAFVGFFETMNESLADLSRRSGCSILDREWSAPSRPSTAPKGSRLRLHSILERERAIYDRQRDRWF